MASKVPTPKDIKAAAQAAAESAQAAAQAAAETAQSAAGAALRIPPASIQLATQLPDLIENLAIATERLNQAIDRAERYLALADPMIRTMDAVLPQLEALVATGNEVYGAVSSLPVSPLWDDWPIVGRLLPPRSRREAARRRRRPDALTSGDASLVTGFSTLPSRSPVLSAATG